MGFCCGSDQIALTPRELLAFADKDSKVKMMEIGVSDWYVYEHIGSYDGLNAWKTALHLVVFTDDSCCESSSGTNGSKSSMMSSITAANGSNRSVDVAYEQELIIDDISVDHHSLKRYLLDHGQTSMNFETEHRFD